MAWTVTSFTYVGLQLLLLAFGVMETYGSVLLLLDSKGLYIGGIYAGIPCIISSLLGLASLFDGNYKYKIFYSAVIMNGACFILSIVATSLLSQLSISLSKLSSCSYYENPPQLQCEVYINNLSCTGNSDDFYFASLCAIGAQPQYKNMPPYYAPNVYDISPAPGKCWCVDSESISSGCRTFSHVDNCEDLFDQFPYRIDFCFIFAFPMIVVTAFLLCYRDPRIVNISNAIPNSRQPNSLLDWEGWRGMIPVATTEGVRVSARDRHLSADTDASVMMVAANTLLTSDIVAAKAEFARIGHHHHHTHQSSSDDVTAIDSDIVVGDLSEPSEDMIVVTVEDNGEVWVSRRAVSSDNVGRRHSDSSSDSSQNDTNNNNNNNNNNDSENRAMLRSDLASDVI